MTQATDDTYYLYVGNGWSGPFKLEQIRLFMRDHQITTETFAYEPQQQMQLTVGQLLSSSSEAQTGSYQSPSAPAETSKTASRMGTRSGNETTKGKRSTRTTRKRDDDDVIDLDQVKTQTNKIIDGDSFDLDAPDAKTSSRAKSRDDGDSFDLDAHDKDKDPRDDAPLTIDIDNDELKGKPAEQRVNTPYEPQPGGENALEVVLSELEGLRKAYNSLMENSIKDREDGQRRVHLAQLAIGEVLDERKADIAEIRSLVAEIDEVASDLAKKHQDPSLSTRIVRLRDSLQQSDVTKMVQFAEAVLRRIVEQAAGDGGKKAEDPFSAFDEKTEPPSQNLVVQTARVELADKQNQLKLLKRSHDELQEALVKEQQQAREQLLKATALLESEKSARENDSAEVRTLAAEIYRLATELDPDTVSEALSAKIISLWDELGNPVLTKLAPVAGEVLIGVVKGLKTKVEKQTSALTATLRNGGQLQQPPTNEVSSLRKQVKELGALRAELLQTRTDLSMMRQREEALQEEKARLQQLLEEQRQISEKAQQAAKAREQRLRSTVCALEVTKELHQEVMRDLQTQLGSAQSRFEEMERELREVRGTISVKKAASNVGQDIQEEMRRLVDMRAMLDARKEELSSDLKSAEAELQRLGDSPDGEDPSLAEALAVKVTQLRHTYEQTQKRLDQQESRAQALQQQLDASRQEAGELRGRSDQLSTELESARTSLSLSKKSVEELHLAYKRLESERESLLNELEKKKGTQSVDRGETAEDALIANESADLMSQLSAITIRADNLDAELSRERRRAQDLSESQAALQARVAELTQDRDQLRASLDLIAEEQTAQQQRHATAISTATQNGLAAETRLAEARLRIEELEKKIRGSGPQPAVQAAADPADRELAEMRLKYQAASAAVTEARVALAAAQAESANTRTASQSRIAELEARLADTETKLRTTSAERDRAQTFAAQPGTSADEVDRLHRELESASNEHRAALTSARNRLAEEQVRAQQLEEDLKAARQQAQMVGSQRETVNAALAVAKSGKDRLETEVGRLVRDLERVTTEKGTNEAKLTAEVDSTRAQLAAAQAQIVELEARLAALQGDAQTLATKVPELEGRLTRAQAERQQLLLELDRLRGELVTHSQRTQVDSDLTAKVDESLRQLQAVTAQRDDLQKRMGSDAANLQRIDAELNELRTREASQSDTLATFESRLSVEHGRFQAANKLLEQARTQHHALSSERDDAKVLFAQSEAQRQNLENQLNRMRSELADLRTRRHSPGSSHGSSQGHTEQDTMNAHAIEDTSRIEALENELIDARMKLKALGTGDDIQKSTITVERDRMARELDDLRQQVAQMLSGPSATGDSMLAARLKAEQSRAQDLERRLSQALRDRETATTEAAAVQQKFRTVADNHTRLEARLEQLVSDPSVALKELETTKRRLKRARRRLRAMEAEREDFNTQTATAETDAEDASAQIEMLRRTSLTIGLGGSLPAQGMPDTVRTAPEGLEGFTQFDQGRLLQQLELPLTGRTPSPFTGRAANPNSNTQPFTSTHGRPAIAASTIAPVASGTGRYRVHPLTLKDARKQARRRMHLALSIGAPACAVAMGMWWVVLPSMFPTTSLAGVNAKFVSVKAPIEGKLSPITRSIGNGLGRDEVLTVIRNDKVDRSTLESLKRRIADSSARKSKLDNDIEELRAQNKPLQTQMLEQRTQLADYLVARISEGSRRIETKENDLAATRAMLRVKSTSQEAGSAHPDLALQAAIEAEAVTTKAVEVQRQSIDRLRSNLAALDAGTFSDD
ncbi:MAG: hypothetical protein H0W83_02560, partial [Planctomycetes bacterium]|nr:hypothetical protein [Planctomycetota bacterium]